MKIVTSSFIHSFHCCGWQQARSRSSPGHLLENTFLFIKRLVHTNSFPLPESPEGFPGLPALVIRFSLWFQLHREALLIHFSFWVAALRQVPGGTHAGNFPPFFVRLFVNRILGFVDNKNRHGWHPEMPGYADFLRAFVFCFFSGISIYVLIKYRQYPCPPLWGGGTATGGG